jgi:hypothetical protein
MTGQQEKRQTARIQPFVAPCRCVVGETRLPGFLTDISQRGARVHVDVPPPAPGTPLVLETRLGRHPTHIRLAAVTRWARPASRGGFLLGLSFDATGSGEGEVLRSVVEEFRRRAAAIG